MSSLTIAATAAATAAKDAPPAKVARFVFEERAVAWVPTLPPAKHAEMRKMCADKGIDMSDVLECIESTAVAESGDAFADYALLYNSEDAAWRLALTVVTLPGVDDMLEHPLVRQRGDVTFVAERNRRRRGEPLHEDMAALHAQSVAFVQRHSPYVGCQWLRDAPAPAPAPTSGGEKPPKGDSGGEEPPKGDSKVDAATEGADGGDADDAVERLMHRGLAVVMVYGYNSTYYTGAVYGVGVWRAMAGRVAPSCDARGVLLSNGPRLRYYAVGARDDGGNDDAPMTFPRLVNLDVETRDERQQRLTATSYDGAACQCARCVRGDGDPDDRRLVAAREHVDAALSVEQRRLEKCLSDVLERMRVEHFDTSSKSFAALCPEALQVAAAVWREVTPAYRAAGVVKEWRALARFITKLCMRVAAAHGVDSVGWALPLVERYYALAVECFGAFTLSLQPTTAHTLQLAVENAFNMIRMNADLLGLLSLHYRTAPPELLDAIERRYAPPPPGADDSDERRWLWDAACRDAFLKQHGVDPERLERDVADAADASSEAGSPEQDVAPRSLEDYVRAYFQRHAPTPRDADASMETYRRAVVHAKLIANAKLMIGGASIVLHTVSRSMDQLGVFSLAPNALLDAHYANVVRSIKKAQQQRQQQNVVAPSGGPEGGGGGAIVAALRDATDATEQLAAAVERQLTLRSGTSAVAVDGV